MKALDRMVNFGGETMTYGEMVKQLHSIAEASGHPDPQVLVSRYLQGFDRSCGSCRQVWQAERDVRIVNATTGGNHRYCPQCLQVREEADGEDLLE